MEKPVSFFNYAQHVHRPPPHIEMMQVNNALAAQNDAIYRRHWSFNNLPLQQLRFASREDAILRDELRQTRKRLTQMERRIEEFEGQLYPHRNRQPHGPRRPFDAMRPQTITETSAEPDLTSWLTQQRQNCELWNQNFALKECLRNIEVENNMLREMCRQKEVNISLLENKTRQLKSDLQFYSDMKHDTKELVQAFNFKPLKEEKVGSYKCTCGQC
ncbi:hypothetical protein ANCCAN_05829 [Ancylostoma caninum]|uniref:Uncharacterized protein n=1 Tax=Ancylostoma caninum TaxID=29170 RepID=A0A368GV00_ANCCA|nr:hypothetical protein ANCCAN_05829 [Ancylostoma caninum]